MLSGDNRTAGIYNYIAPIDGTLHIGGLGVPWKSALFKVNGVTPTEITVSDSIYSIIEGTCHISKGDVIDISISNGSQTQKTGLNVWCYLTNE